VPFISGGLKALSPAGNRVRPMLAIVMQGLLSAPRCRRWAGTSSASRSAARSSARGRAAGFVLQYLLLGGELIKAYDTAVLWLANHWHISAPGLPWLVGAWAALHAFAGASATFAAWRLRQPPAALQRIIDRETAPAAPTPARTGWRRLREFGSWQFWIPLVLVQPSCSAAAVRGPRSRCW